MKLGLGDNFVCTIVLARSLWDLYDLDNYQFDRNLMENNYEISFLESSFQREQSLFVHINNNSELMLPFKLTYLDLFFLRVKCL